MNLLDDCFASCEGNNEMNLGTKRLAKDEGLRDDTVLYGEPLEKKQRVFYETFGMEDLPFGSQPTHEQTFEKGNAL